VTTRPRRSAVLLGAGAALVGGLLLGACGGDGGGGDQAYVEPKGKPAETISIDAGNFFFDPDAVTAAPGVAEIDLVGIGGLHTLVFDDGAYPGFQLEVAGSDDTDAKKIKLKQGKYTFYCDIPGHRQQGMEGTLTVK
jgi:plastocyanin